MAVDRAGAEDVERPAAEAPPPPPDRPGAEGYPSRAESRAAAAAASDHGSRPDGEAGDEESGTSSAGSAGEGSGRQVDAEASDGEQSPGGSDSRHDGPDADRTDDDGTDQRSSLERDTRGDDPALSDIGSGISVDAADQRDTPPGEDTESDRRPVEALGEAADEPHPDGSPGPEAPSPSGEEQASDSRGDTTQAVDGPDPDMGDHASDQVVDADQATGPPEAPDSTDSEEDQPADDVRVDPVAETADEPTVPERDTIIDSGGEMTEDADPTKDTELADKPRAGETEPTGEDAVQSGEPSDEKPWDYEFRVNDDLVRVRGGFEPIRPEDWSNEVGDQMPDPADRAGDRIVNAEKSEESQPEKIRRKFYEVVGDAHDVTAKAANRGRNIFDPPSAGQAETRPPGSGPAMIGAQHAGIDAGSAATALLTAAVIGAELIRWGHEKVGRNQEGDDDGGSR